MSKIQNLFSSNFFQLAILLVIGFVIKGLYIGVMDIGMDECFSVYTAQLSPSQIISWLSTGDNPPLWELLLHYWIKLFGISELSIRIPSYLFNVLTIIPIYFLGEKFIAKRIGLTASILFTLSSLSLFMAHEARVYSLLGFLSMHSVYLFVSSIKGKNQIRSLVFLTLVNGLILYTHYLGYWIILVQIICFLSVKSIRQVLLKKYLIHLGVLLLLFLPILPVLYDRILNSGLNGTWISTVTGLEDLYNMIWKFSNKPITTVIFLAFISVGLALRIIHRRKKFNQSVFLIHLFLWIPLLGSFLLSFKVGFFLDRYFYFLSPLFYLVVATSIWRTFYFNKKIRMSVAIISLVLMGITFKPHTQESKISGYHKNNKKLVSKIKEYSSLENVQIYLAPNWYDKVFTYYHNPELFTSYFEEFNQSSVFQKPLNEKNILPINNSQEIQFNENVEQIIYIDNQVDFSFPNNGIHSKINELYYLNSEIDIDGIIIREYNKK